MTAKSVWKMHHDELVEQAAIICDEFGVTLQYWPDSRRARSRGFPDLLIAGRAILYREIKTMEDGVEQAQWEWADRLTSAGQDWAVWRPTHFANGSVRKELAAIA
jgi:hypothetical protein